MANSYVPPETAPETDKPQSTWFSEGVMWTLLGTMIMCVSGPFGAFLAILYSNSRSGHAEKERLERSVRPCVRCGRILAETSRICPRCGHRDSESNRLS